MGPMADAAIRPAQLSGLNVEPHSWKKDAQPLSFFEGLGMQLCSKTEFHFRR